MFSGPNKNGVETREPTIREQVQGPETEGRARAYDTGAGRVGTQCRSRSRRNPRKPTMRGQVASGPDAEAGRGAQANDTGEGRVGTQHRSRTRRDPRENTGTGRVGTQYTGYITPDETNDAQNVVGPVLVGRGILWWTSFWWESKAKYTKLC